MKNRNKQKALRQIKKRKQRQQGSSPKEPTFNGFAYELLHRDNVSLEHKNAFRATFNKVIEDIKDTSPQEDYEQALELIDKTYEVEPKTISCAAKCSACCHQTVSVLSLEEERIKNYLDTNEIDIDFDRLDKQEAVNGDSLKLPYEDRACIFLDEEQNCRIYEVRPLVCRRYYVLSDPKHCKTLRRDLIDLSFNFPCDSFLSGIMNKYSTRRLATFVRSLFKKDS